MTFDLLQSMLQFQGLNSCEGCIRSVIAIESSFRLLIVISMLILILYSPAMVQAGAGAGGLNVRRQGAPKRQQRALFRHTEEGLKIKILLPDA